MKLQDISSWRASTESGFEGLFTEDYHCCNQRALILQSELVIIVAGHSGLT
jgi:hypothetical protein